MNKKIYHVIQNIQPLDKKIQDSLHAYHKTLLMPLDALSVPLSYVETLAGIYGEMPVRKLAKKRVVLFAADHGISEEGVSAYPQEVTRQMLFSFINNWAVITVLAKEQSLDIIVLDMGVKGEAVKDDKIISKKLGPGTKNFLKENAMSSNQTEKALMIGIEMAGQTKAKGYDIALVGEMGIGNTTSASAITSVLLNMPVETVTGRGTGVSDTVYAQKIAVIEKVLAQRNVQKADALEVLEKVGGFEIAAMTGFLLGAAYYKLPVMLDGFITGASALLAYQLAPMSKNYWIAGHVSKEQGHKKILEALSLRPMLSMDLRLGEASGAAFALPVLEQAIAVSRNTGTFEKAHVATSSE